MYFPRATTTEPLHYWSRSAVKCPTYVLNSLYLLSVGREMTPRDGFDDDCIRQHLGHKPAGQGPDARRPFGTATVPLRIHGKASPFWIT